MSKRKKSEDVESLDGYTFEGEPVVALAGKLKGAIPLDRMIHDGDALVLVLDVTAGPAQFVRKNGLLIRQHTLTIARGKEPSGSDIADDVQAFVEALREDEARAKAEAEQIEGQATIDDELLAQEAERLLRERLKGLSKPVAARVAAALGLEPASTVMQIREQLVEPLFMLDVPLFDAEGRLMLAVVERLEEQLEAASNEGSSADAESPDTDQQR